jgi:hypothetical protein
VLGGQKTATASISMSTPRGSPATA